MGAKRQLNEAPVEITIRIPAHLEQEIRAKADSLALGFDDLAAALLRHGLAAKRQSEADLVELVERFRSEENEDERKRLGEKLGVTLFG